MLLPAQKETPILSTYRGRFLPRLLTACVALILLFTPAFLSAREGQTPQPIAAPAPPQPAADVQVLLDAAQKEATARHWKEALALFEQAGGKARTLGDRAGEAAALRGSASAHFYVTGLPKALELHQQALPIYRAIGDKSGELRTLSSMGSLYWRTGRTQESLAAHTQARALAQTLGDKAGEARALTGLGIVYDTLGERAKSLEALQNALALQRAAGDQSGEATTLNNLGDLYAKLGQTEKALEYCRLALPLFQSLQNKNGEAIALTTTADAYLAMENYAEALVWCEKALPIMRESGDQGGIAYILTNMGFIYARTNQPEKGIEALQKAVDLRHGIGDVGGESYALNTLGYLYSSIGRQDDALARYGQALAIFEQTNDSKGRAVTLGNIAIVQSRQNKLTQADASFRRAIELLEAQRKGLSGLTDAKIAFFESSVANYAVYLDVLLRQGRAADAFALAQKMKARVLLDLMEDGKVDMLPRLTAEERGKLAQLRARPDAFNKAMIAEGVKNEVGSKKRYEAVQAQLKQAERELSSYTDLLYTRHPDIAQARSARTLSAAQAARLLPPDTALLEYATRRPVLGQDLSERLTLFVTTPDGKVTAHEVPTTVPRLRETASALRIACASPKNPYQAQAREMYRQIIAPAGARLAGKKRLIICPDGPLWDVPFAALLAPGDKPNDNSEQFLADRYVLSFAYSATGMEAALASAARRTTKPTRSALALANPDFGDARRFGDDPHLPGQRPIEAPSRPIEAPARPIEAPARPIEAPARPIEAPSRDLNQQLRAGMMALPGTQQEADLLRRLYPDSALYTGKKAQESTFKAEAGKYRYLHLASHAFFNDSVPLLSSIFLAAPPASGPGSGEDGFLTARELFDMKLNADLVTLSACQTGRGQTRSGEGVVGLTWALNVAGCPTQIVSQWSVDDAATATLMTGFYRNLKAGAKKSDALRAAARSVRNAPARKHPYYWAAFLVMGDWR